MKIIAIVGVYIWGALYAAGVFTAALIWDDRIAVMSAITCAAAAYVSQFLMVLGLDEELPFDARKSVWYGSLIATAASILAGFVAGFHLMFGG